MNKYGKLTRAELILHADELADDPEFMPMLDVFMDQAIERKDLELVGSLLKTGASPEAREPLDDYLLYLLHEYRAGKTTSGDSVLKIMQLLLDNGADPNRVSMNNQRAYDYAVRDGVAEVASLLLSYGAHPETREYI